MSRWLLGAALIVAVVLMGCGSSISVQSDYDPASDFSKLKTFIWYDIPKREADDALSNQLLANRVKAAVEKVLTEKGFVRAQDGQPDFVVAAHLGAKEKMNVTNWGYGYGPYWGRGGYGNNIDVSYYTEASLVIDVVRNTKPAELVWRGVGTGAVSQSQKSPEEIQERLNEAVSQILYAFPPGSEKK